MYARLAYGVGGGGRRERSFALETRKGRSGKVSPPPLSLEYNAGGSGGGGGGGQRRRRRVSLEKSCFLRTSVFEVLASVVFYMHGGNNVWSSLHKLGAESGAA